MTSPATEIMVGVLGQWASGKTTAARTLVRYLGGEGKAAFINDRDLVAAQAVRHILESEASKVLTSVAEDGTRRLDGELGTVWVDPGQDPGTVDLSTVRFNCPDDVLHIWIDRARVELGHQICARSKEGRPIVIEAGFGTNTKQTGENPFSHTISDLFGSLEEGGVEPQRVRWIIIEAPYDRRLMRNQTRPDGPPTDVFDRYAAHGGDLDPDQQMRLEEGGTKISRVPNDHDDIERFRADIIVAFENMYCDVLLARADGGT